MSSLVLCSLLVIAFVKLGIHSQITLSPTKAYVAENTSVVLTCSKTNGQLLETKWTNSQMKDQKATLVYYNNKCTQTIFLQTNDLFSGVCYGNGTYSVRLERVDHSQNGAVWKCWEGLNSSNPVTIYISVPIASVDIQLSDATYMKENNVYLIKCKPSVSRPKPTISWHLQNPKNHVEYTITENSTQTDTENEDNGLISAESTLHLVPNRSINGWMLHCQAWTDKPNSALESKQILINVSYPPDSAPVINGYESGETYRFIEADQANFFCSVTGGNPLATLRWNCFGSTSTPLTLVNKTVVSKVTLKVERYQNFCSCESHHTVYGTQATNVILDILYPPEKPEFWISSTHVSHVVNIIQNNTLHVTCISRSNPPPNYTWTGADISDKAGETLIVSTIDMNIERQYKCTAANRMVRSNETSRDARNSSSLTVKVLYPPGHPMFRYGESDGQMTKLDAIDVIKGTTFSVYCNATGYPTPDIVWDNLTIGHLLNIRTITSDSKRTCTATNKMNETAGESRVGSASSTLSITVLCMYNYSNQYSKFKVASHLYVYHH